MAGVYKEIWTGEVIKKFEKDDSFLSVIPDKSVLVGNAVIHAVDLGADPNVLVNNTTYPIGSVAWIENDVTFTLDKLDTENTDVTEDQLYAISYDVMREVVDAHARSLREQMSRRAIHAIAPSADGAKTPIVQATGLTDGGTNPRKQITKADLIKLKERFDTQDVPLADRIIVLNPIHVAQILNWNESFRDQFMNIGAGQPINLYGFRFYQFNGMPIYTNVFAKKTLTAAAAPTTDCYASVAFYAPRTFKAISEVEFYYRERTTNPEYRKSTAGYRVRFGCFPKKAEAIGAIVSGVVS